MKNKKKFNFSGIVAFVCAVLVLLIFVPVNLIATYRDKVFDMTPSKQYTLDSRTKELLDDTSDKNIEIYCMWEKLQLLQDNPELLALYHTLTELKSRDNISVTCFIPDEDPDLARSLDPNGVLGISQGDIFVKCGDVIKRIQNDKVYVRSGPNGEMREYAGEDLIAGAIKTCTSGSLPTIYFLTGHGEKSVNDAYSFYANQIKYDNYSVAELNLDEAGAIPGNTASIWLVGPQNDITAKEADMLIGFLGNGGSVAILAGPSETEGRFRNLEKVLSKYGIELDYDIVSETYSASQLRDHDGTQNPNYFRAELTNLDKDSFPDLPVQLNEDLMALVDKGYFISGIFNARSIGVLPEDQYDATRIEVASAFHTSGTYAIDPNKYTHTTLCKPMGGDATTAENAEKNLSGADFDLDLAAYAYDRISGGKLFVIGSNDLIDPDYMPAAGYVTTQLVIMVNTWLYNTDVEMGLGNKANAYDTMNFKSAKEAKRVMALTTILPGTIMVFGILVWLKRRYA
ncbi:MAG: Gldg family protein [Ruminococcus sp.]|nr:Gldg family protein [Ruminococcus sp.]